MQFLFGLIIVILTVVYIDLIASVLISYWYVIIAVLTVIYFFVVTSSPKLYEFPGSEKVLLISKWIIKAAWIFIATLVAFILFRMFTPNGEEDNTDKKLNVAMKDNTPCFYIDVFEDINTFEIQNIIATKQVNNEASEYHKVVWDTPKIHIPLTAIVSKNQCIPYGLKNEIHTEGSKKLETNVLYQVMIHGVRKNITEIYNTDLISAGIYFYLFKNSKTGKTEIVLASQKQINHWENSMLMARLNSLKHASQEEDVLAEQTNEHNTIIKTKDHK
jgi:hypothetical protein